LYQGPMLSSQCLENFAVFLFTANIL
jgi:hypothetical protein